MVKVYWHKLSDSKRNELKKSTMKFDEFLKKYSQPDWCSYPDALGGVMGCWSLFFNPENISKKFCKTCDCYKKVGGQ